MDKKGAILKIFGKVQGPPPEFSEFIYGKKLIMV